MPPHCNGICVRFKPTWQTGTPRYTETSCRCTVCAIWLDTHTGTMNYRCNCCHSLVTTRPKIKVRLSKPVVKKS